jgi:hypothetical protein
MPGLKLAKLPDRTPVKVTITVSPELNRWLQLYAELYHTEYGEAEPIPELIPYIIEFFLENDRGFIKARKERPLDEKAIDLASAPLVRRRRRKLSGTPSTEG